MAPAQTLRLGDVLLDPGAGCLRGSDGAEIALRPKSFDLLAVLARNPRRTLSRNELLDTVWPGVTVTDESVTQCVREVRRAIGDPHGRLLRTVARRGYRLDLEVAPTAPAGYHSTAVPTGAGPSVPSLSLALPDKPSVAVLAFDNMSGDPDQEYFSDGVAEDIITELSHSRSLFVVARNSSFTYKSRPVDVKQIARELGVRYVVEGSVRRSGGRVRISAQLIDAEADLHLWAERYDRHDTELFAVQDEISTAVTTAICPAVTNAELRRVLHKPAESLGAWEAYQRGLWHMAKSNAGDNERAIELFQSAIEQDKTFVAAYVSLAFAYCESGHSYAVRPFGDAVRLAGIWAGKAAQIDPQDADVQTALGFVAHFSGRREEAWECASSALANSPHWAGAYSLKGTVLIFNGQPVEGRSAVLTALRLNPRHPGLNASRLNMITISYYYEGDYASAAEAAKRTLARYPIARYPNNVIPYHWLAAALGQLGRTDEAREALHTAATTDPRVFDRFVLNRVPWHPPEDYEHMLDGLRKAGWQG
jgi:adenylate cyclase